MSMENTPDSALHRSADDRSLGERIGSMLRSRATLAVVLALTLVLFWLLGWRQGASGADLLSLTVWGVMLGGIIALGAIGLTLVYGVLKFPNFSHGALVTLGAYAAFTIASYLPQGPILLPFSFGWELLAAMVLAMPVVSLIALAVDRVLFRPLRRRDASLVLLAMASLAAMFFLRSAIYLIWGPDFLFYYPGRSNPALHLPFGLRLQADQIFVFVLAMILVALTWFLLERTRMGKAMRATSNNPDLAQVRGINTERVIAWTWILGASLAAAGGVMYGLASQLRPEMGFWLLLPMFAAAIMGGLGSPMGAIAGAVIIGIAQQVSSSFINPAYGPGVAFVLLVVVLVLQPRGLFGRGGI
ncbi:branched-chain amino acid ABC transporter permease [Pontibaca methylaminivorans]|uniref:Branched-chain amino acid transport system permease protein/neutral amino acid transport system permease protein n=1 Tax=Pontibaca methylaminivorans TaxID=515897 RepID=A0A1R3WKQ8_9RHOB|nr:branched-chain amino acid ABC transporter permease [Pontibaca methylaminivorans]SIT78468.1 branched-chain amino acid transport system permease protein/neutral amino acid transport system permease protein [Pontibaca methylaminivorans]